MANITSARITDYEPDRAIVHANGIVVDVIANDDGSLYVECYAEIGARWRVVVDHAAIDRDTVRHPNIRLALAHTPEYGLLISESEARVMDGNR